MKLFPTQSIETWKSRLWRMGYNLVPLLRRTGGRMAFRSDDWTEVHMRLPLNFWTRNYAGTVFGGAMFAAVDAVPLVQLYYLLGKDYIFWDKSAHIRFIRPGKESLKAKILFSPEIIQELNKQLLSNPEIDFSLQVSWLNDENKAVATIDKVIYIAHKQYYYTKHRAKPPLS